jgi:CheY-like chemotaxis protein/nitrogen-specific signal transduction histidine kinase
MDDHKQIDSKETIEELKKKLEQQTNDLDNLQSSQSVFLRNLSQNIRIPLNGMIGMIDVMKMTNINKEQQDYLDIINKYGENLIVIVNDILDYSRILTDELKFDNKYFNISKLIHATEQSYRLRIEGKGLQFHIFSDPNLPTQIITDEYRIHQILSNLINNAIKFTKEGAIGLKFELLEASNQKSIIRFLVEDSGYGMSSQKQKQIRSELGKAAKETFISVDGIGLGLSISQALLRLMNSEIFFESNKDQGSRFWFDLQVASRKNQSPVHTNLLANNTKPLSILLVEDNVLNQRFAVATLTKNGHKVDIAENGKIAFEKYKNGSFDLVLMDVQMPVMDGVQATLNIRRWEKEQNIKAVKIVAVTAYAMDRDRERCLKSGMDKFLAKPFKSEQLISMIEQLEFD